MSEIESAQAAESTPADTSTASIAEQAYDQLEAAETPTTDTGDVVTDGGLEAPAAPLTPAEAATLSEEEQLLQQFGFKQAFKPDGREHYIARSKVLKMIASGLKRGQETWGTERQTLDGELSGYREKFGALTPVLEALDQGPDAFLAFAASRDPRYQQYVAGRQAQAPAQAFTMPEPDIDLGNGAKTYSLDGIKKLVEAVAEAKTQAALKPLAEREQRAQAETAAQAAVQDRTRSIMADAQTWPHFGAFAADGSLNEVQADVLALLREDSAQAKAAGRRPALSMEGAYIKVMAKRLPNQEKDIRAKVLAELKTAPKAPTVAQSGGETPTVPSGGRSTAEIAARAYDRLERGA